MKFIIEKKDFNDLSYSCDLFSTYGILKIKLFFSEKEILEVKEELMKYYAKIPIYQNISFNSRIKKHAEYESGKGLRISRDYYRGFSKTVNLIQKEKILSQFVDYFFPVPNQKNLQIFSTYDFVQVNCEQRPRNSWLHFDPYKAIKFAVMLQETNKDNGCLFVIPKSQKEGKFIRENLMEHKISYKKGLSHRFVDYSEKIKTKFSENDIVYVDSDVGDLIILNTDCWHGGGNILKPGKERIAIYYHNRKWK